MDPILILLITLLGNFISATLIGLSIFLARKKISELFYKERVNWKDCRLMATKIIDIVADQKSDGYKDWGSKEQQQEIYRLASHMERYDEELPLLLTRFNSLGVAVCISWNMAQLGSHNQEAIKEMRDRRKENDEIVKEIIKRCNQLKK